MLRRRDVGYLALASLFSLAAQTPQAPATSDQPHVVLVSFDGFRNDYATRHPTPNLNKLGARGAVAKALIPPFPPMTFSSHYTLVTGVRPEVHGIVDNAFYDPERDEGYQFSVNASEGKWYKSPPIWVTAAHQGVRTASYAWPGSEAEINGIRPFIWRKYAQKGTNDQQIEQAVEWLRLPDAERPRLVILYFNDADTTGHHHGPDSPQLQSAVAELDRVVGRLQESLQKLPLRINLVVVSDHGMRRVEGRVALRDYTDITRLRAIQAGASIVHLYTPDAELREKVYRDLKGRSKDFDVHRRAETPSRWRYSQNPRIGDLLVVATGTKMLDARSLETAGAVQMPSNKGAHGFDPDRFPEMKGIFVAAGPNIRPGRELGSFEAIHVYPLIARILGITKAPNIDGKDSVLRDIYRK